jgi:hypothetical protein
MNNLCFMVDIKHGLALLPGTEEEVTERVQRVRRKLHKNEMDMVMTVMVGRDVDEAEAEYMRTHCLLPRRVLMRLRKS